MILTEVSLVYQTVISCQNWLGFVIFGQKLLRILHKLAILCGSIRFANITWDKFLILWQSNLELDFIQEKHLFGVKNCISVRYILQQLLFVELLLLSCLNFVFARLLVKPFKRIFLM